MKQPVRRIQYRGGLLTKEDAVRLLENLGHAAFAGFSWDHPRDGLIGDSPLRWIDEEAEELFTLIEEEFDRELAQRREGSTGRRRREDEKMEGFSRQGF